MKKSWGEDKIVAEAVQIAGTHKAFAMQKHKASKPLGPQGDGWKAPCEFELLAGLARITSTAASWKEPQAPPTPPNYQKLGSSCSSPPQPEEQPAELVTSEQIRAPIPLEQSPAQLPSYPALPPLPCSAAQVLFLLDGSGSVGREEFYASAAFIVRATAALKAQKTENRCRVSVNGCRVSG